MSIRLKSSSAIEKCLKIYCSILSHCSESEATSRRRLLSLGKRKVLVSFDFNFNFVHFSNELEEQMICHEESLTVKPETCINRPCNETCEPQECELCWDCLKRNEKHDMHLAYREAKHRGAMKRVFPPPKVCFYYC